MIHGNGSSSVRHEYKLVCGIKSRRIHALSDRSRADYFSVIGIENDHQLSAAAARKQTTRLWIECESGCRLAGREGPAVPHFQSLGVDVHGLRFLFEIDVDVSLSICGGRFRIASQS